MTVEAWERAPTRVGYRERSTPDRSWPTRPIGAVASVISVSPWFTRATPERRRALAATVTDARRRCAERKVRVQAHPDLAARLVRALDLKRFDQWGGYVPPRCDGPESPVRAELLAILRAVQEREAGESCSPG